MGSATVVFAGTGENDGGGDLPPGQGMLRSLDGGETWTVATAPFAGHHVGAIVIPRSDASARTALAATDAGLFRTSDQGATWVSVTPSPAGTATNARALVQDPSDPATIWVTVGDGCAHLPGVFISHDAGVTWSAVAAFSSGATGTRIGLGVGLSHTAYAVRSSCAGGLDSIVRTSDGGATWTVIPNNAPGLYDYFDFFGTGPGGSGDSSNAVAVDPVDPAHAVFLGVSALATKDGGATFTDITRIKGGGVVHVDQHAATFTGHDTFFLGNDGGLWQTSDLGGSGSASDWTNLNGGLTTAEMYAGAALSATEVAGGAQDNGTVALAPGGSSAPGWQQYGPGDGGHTALVAPSAGTPGLVYTSAQGLFIQRGPSTVVSADPSSPYSGQVNASPCGPTGVDAACSEASAFVTPLGIDPANSQRLATGTTSVYVTTDGGVPAGSGSWSALSGPGPHGFTSPIGRVDFSGPTTGGVTPVIAASSGGEIGVSTDGSTMHAITGNLAGTGGTPVGIVPRINPTLSRSSISEAWAGLAVVGGVADVWHSVNAGATQSGRDATVWSSLDGPGRAAPFPGLPVTTVVQDSAVGSRIYVATSDGVWMCRACGGASPHPAWHLLGSNLPRSVVSDLTLAADSSVLVAFTLGRGAWTIAPPAAAPDAEWSPMREDLGSVEVGTTAQRTVHFQNTGDAPLHIGSVTAAGTDADAVRVSGGCAGITVAAGESCDATLAVTATHTGALSATISAASDALSGATESLPLTATGVAAPPPPPGPPSPPSVPRAGYWLVASDGGIFPFGGAAGYGSTGDERLNQPIVGMARTPDGGGYWLVASDGGIFPFGSASGYGSTGGTALNQPVVGMAATPSGQGYWLVARDGGIFPFGDAAGYGSTGGIHLNQPIVGMAATPSGRGYWLVASDGGIFPFGDAAGYGSTGGIHLNQPVVGMARTSTGGGYWLVASDGGIFPFGDATGYGSTGGTRLNQPIVGMAGTSTGAGYWLVSSDGGIFPFGDAGGYGSTGDLRLNRPIVGMTPL